MRTTTVSAGRANLWAYIVVLLLPACGGNPDVPSGLLDVDQLAGGGGGSGNGGASGGGTTVSGDTAAGGPVAVLEASATVGFAPLTVRFSAGGSRAAAGRIADYAWDFDDGQTGDTAELFHTFIEPGLYAVELTVFDERGGSGQVELKVAVLPPVEIACSPAGARGVAPLRAQFGVTTMPGALHVPVDVQYHWDFGDGTAGQGPNVVRVYERPGRYTVTLALVVGALTLRGDQMVVTVDGAGAGENQPPVADAGPDQVVVDANGDGVEVVRLDGSGSRDADGEIVWYRWSAATGPEGEGVLAQGKQPSSQVSMAVGQHEITLTVTDDHQATGQDKVRVAVVARAALAVTPNASFTSLGEVGGSFAPGQMMYTLRNAGQQALEWSASTGQGWLAVSPGAGSLAGGKSVEVTATIQVAPAALGAGVHRDTLTFTNRTNDVGTTTRGVELTVTDPARPLISGRVVENGGAGVGDVVLAGLPDDPKTNSEGYYVASVPLGWSGTVTPTKAGYTFSPVTRVYSNVTANQVNQDYTATPLNEQWADHVSQYGITWTFDKPYRVGQFVNGDWWVCPDTPGGTVTVVSVDPAPTGAAGTYRNGSMVNPVPGSTQGYDGRAVGYTVSLSVGFPYPLPTSASLISTISRPEDACFNPPGSALYGNTCSRGYLADAAILTCLAIPAPADALRPPYCGTSKVIHRASRIDLNKLPSLASVAGTPTLAHLERGFQRVWLDHMDAVSSQTIHPNNHMPSYGRDIASWIGQACLMLCLGDVGDRTILARELAQLGIDLYGIGVAGGGARWAANGGHAHGRKLPIVLAGYLLYDPHGTGEANEQAWDMLNIGQKPRYGQAGAWRFQEDENHWIVSEADVGRSIDIMAAHGLAESVTANTLGVTRPTAYAPLESNYVDIVSGPGAGQRRYIVESTVPRSGGSGVITVSEPWDVMPVVGESCYQVVGYERSHIGMAEWGIGHASGPKRDNPGWAAEYRTLVGTSSVGFTLAARLLGLKDVWNHDALFEYMDRYVSTQGATGFVANMWAAYRGHD